MVKRAEVVDTAEPQEASNVDDGTTSEPGLENVEDEGSDVGGLVDEPVAGEPDAVDTTTDKDIIFGGDGDDWIFGENDNDLIFGNTSPLEDELLRSIISGRLQL